MDLRVYLTAPTLPSQITLVPTPTSKHFIASPCSSASQHFWSPSLYISYVFVAHISFYISILVVYMAVTLWLFCITVICIMFNCSTPRVYTSWDRGCILSVYLGVLNRYLPLLFLPGCMIGWKIRQENLNLLLCLLSQHTTVPLCVMEALLRLKSWNESRKELGVELLYLACLKSWTHLSWKFISKVRS